MEIKDLEQILGLLKHADVSEFEMNQDGIHLKLSRGPRHVMQSRTNGHHVAVEQAISAPLQAALSQAGMASNANASVASHLKPVESPIVGTFFRKPSPDAEFFVQEGDRIKKGETLCIIEAMKLMNEIDSPCDGKVEKILISDGKVVEFGEVLFLIDPT